ncbi:MAG: histidine kinase dimerization/phospho-acceptor domain-containing protein, partial [Terriglobales bacterium]
DRALQLFLALRKSQIKGGEGSWKEREPLWLGLRRCATSIMSSEMIEIGNEEKAQAERSPEVQKQYRRNIRQLVFAGAGINLLLAAGLAIFLTRRIMARLKQINDNAYRLASNLPLNPQIGGTDELASLDQTFHTMAAALKESVRKERTVLENTRDCICSIDEDGTITSTNPACATMFKFDNSELLGRRFIELVDDRQRQSAHSFLLRQQSGEDTENLELMMKRQDGTTFDALWSAQWSQEEKALFCVIRDQSERIQAERVKQEVVAMVTHDLRSPLTIIQNFLEHLDEDGIYGSVTDRGRRYLVASRLNCNRMLELINDLLDIEKIKSGMMSMEAGESDLAEIIKQSVELLNPLDDEHGVKVVCVAQPLV